MQVINTGLNPVTATIRVFMAPKYNERGRRFDLKTQRKLFFEMDKFAHTRKELKFINLHHSIGVDLAWKDANLSWIAFSFLLHSDTWKERHCTTKQGLGSDNSI